MLGQNVLYFSPIPEPYSKTRSRAAVLLLFLLSCCFLLGSGPLNGVLFIMVHYDGRQCLCEHSVVFSMSPLQMAVRRQDEETQGYNPDGQSVIDHHQRMTVTFHTVPPEWSSVTVTPVAFWAAMLDQNDPSDCYIKYRRFPSLSSDSGSTELGLRSTVHQVQAES